MTHSAPDRGTVPHLTAESAGLVGKIRAIIADTSLDAPAAIEQVRTVLDQRYGEREWLDLAEQRAAAEGIPLPAEVDAILGRHSITGAEIKAHIKAEQDAIADGSLVPLSSARRAGKSERDPS